MCLQTTAGNGVIGTTAAVMCCMGFVASTAKPVEISIYGPSLLGNDVACWPFSALWPPTGNKGKVDTWCVAHETWPRGLDEVSAMMLLTPSNILDVTVILSYVSQLSALRCSPWVWYTGYCVGEWLVVCEHHEPASLYHTIPDVLNAGVDSLSKVEYSCCAGSNFLEKNRSRWHILCPSSWCCNGSPTCLAEASIARLTVAFMTGWAKHIACRKACLEAVKTSAHSVVHVMGLVPSRFPHQESVSGFRVLATAGRNLLWKMTMLRRLEVSSQSLGEGNPGIAATVDGRGCTQQLTHSGLEIK